MAMNIQTNLICTCSIAFGIFLVVNAFHLNAYAKPVPAVSASPSCGPRSGFSVLINAKGFEPNGVLAWKLVDSDGTAPLIGYFHIDGNGEVKDQTAIDDVKVGHYKLQVGDDRNIDFKFDSDLGVTQSNITVPCKDGGEKQIIGEDNDTHKTQKVEEKNMCKTENENQDYSKDNGNENDHGCANTGLNLNKVQKGSAQPSTIAAQSGQ